LDNEFKALKPIINASAVVAYNGKLISPFFLSTLICIIIYLGWLGGFNVKYNTDSQTLQSNNLALSYVAKQFVFTTAV
jgi:hypothetical protein